MLLISSMITNLITNLYSCNTQTHHIIKFPLDGINHQLLGDIPRIGILSLKTPDSKTTRLNILTLSSLKYLRLVHPNLVHLEKEIKNLFLKSFSEMLRKNLLQIVTTWKFLMNLPETTLKEKPLELDGNLIRKISLIIEKMSTQLSRINKIHQQNMKVNICLISVRESPGKDKKKFTMYGRLKMYSQKMA